MGFLCLCLGWVGGREENRVGGFLINVPTPTPFHTPHTAGAAASATGGPSEGSSHSQEVPAPAVRHILELLLHLTQASPRVRVDMLAPAAAIAGGEGAEEEGAGAEPDTLLGHLLDLLAHPSYAAHGTRLDALLQLVETVAVTLQGYMAPDERRKGACCWVGGWYLVLIDCVCCD